MNDFNVEVLDLFKEDILEAIKSDKTLCIIEYDEKNKELTANKNVIELIKDFSSTSFLNPSLAELVSLKGEEKTKLFSGYITLGSYDTLNFSIYASVFRKNNKILIFGGTEPNIIINHNFHLHKLNQEILNLERELIREKNNLTETLRKFNELNKELEIANSTKDKFFSIIAHDLRGPFANLLGYIGLLRKNVDKNNDEKNKEYVDIIENSAKNIFELLENLLIWSRIQMKRITPLFTDFLVDRIIDDIIELVKQQAINKNITVYTEINESLMVHADIDMVKTILRNLVSNSIKFSYNGGKVVIKAYKEEDKINISVCDNGVGMTEEQINSIFKIDKQITTTGTSGEKGTGLGLILCKEFVEMNNGQLSIKSIPNKETIISFSLPLT